MYLACPIRWFGLESDPNGSWFSTSHIWNTIPDLLKRAYIEARYSLSYHVTAEELRILREQVLDLASRVRHACMTKLMTISETGSIGELPTLPADEGDMQLPPLA